MITIDNPHPPSAGLAKTVYLLLFLFTMSVEITSAETLYTDLPTGPGLILEYRANARHRSQVVPAPLSLPVSPTPGASLAASTGPPRISWAALLARIFALDVTRCPACGGGLRLIAALTDPASIRRYLHGVGLPTQPSPQCPPRPPSQLEWDHC